MKKFNLVLPVILSLIGLVSADSADGYYGCGMWGGMIMGRYGFGMGIFGWIIGLLLVVALVLLIIWLVRQLQHPKKRK